MEADYFRLRAVTTEAEPQGVGYESVSNPAASDNRKIRKGSRASGFALTL